MVKAKLTGLKLFRNTACNSDQCYNQIEVTVTTDDTTSLQQLQATTSDNEFVETVNTEMDKDPDLKNLLQVGTINVNGTVTATDGNINIINVLKVYVYKISCV